MDLRLNASAGLGSQSNQRISMDEGGHLPRARKAAEMRLKMRRRFEQSKTADLFSQADDECDDVDNNPSK